MSGISNTTGQPLVKGADRGRRRKAIPKIPVMGVVALCLAGTYILRNSVIVEVVPGSSGALGAASYGLLGLCFLRIVVSSWRPVAAGLVMLVSFLPGSLFSAASQLTLTRLGGVALLAVVVGPVLDGIEARRIRRWAWRGAMLLAFGVGVTSFFWWALRLPSLGVGGFTGVMAYANTLGPFAGLGAIYGASMTLTSGGRARKVWFVGSAMCALTCLVAASRVSIASLAVAVPFMHLLENRRSGSRLLVSLGGYLVIGVSAVMAVSAMERFKDLRELLKAKSEQNTREVLWEARWREFKNHPAVGVGVGFAEVESAFEGLAVDEKGRVTVEPGSSYLAVLSMTGVCGALGLTLVLVWIGTKCVGRWEALSAVQSMQLAGVGSFIAVNGIAEGWILAVGSPLCLIFWLWLGRMMDATTRPTGGNRKPRRRQRSQRKIQAASHAGEAASAAGSPPLVPEA